MLSAATAIVMRSTWAMGCVIDVTRRKEKELRRSFLLRLGIELLP
jgi:hypothetical protein